MIAAYFTDPAIAIRGPWLATSDGRTPLKGTSGWGSYRRPCMCSDSGDLAYTIAENVI